MKRFLKGVVEWKSYACMMFTGSICVYGLVAYFLGEHAVSLEILFQLLILSIIGSLIQGIAFAENWLIRKMTYAKRACLFAVLFLPVLIAFAVIFQWFPTRELASWGVFLLIFVIIFIVVMVGFEIIFRITGKKYDGLLGEYKKKNEVGINKTDRS